jgi:pimeloyl-ACP methyl ester carboxylesterase
MMVHKLRFAIIMDEKILLKDGRTLAYKYYGPSAGRRVLYFHGTPSSSREIELLQAFDINPEEILKDANVRLIAIDRPGMGRSSFNPKGNFKSFAEDVNELMDKLGIDKCPVLCWSGGGTYALSMAFHFASRVESVYIICGFSKLFDEEILNEMGFNKWYFIMARKWPGILRSSMNMLRKKAIKRFIPQKFTGLSYVDYALLDHPEHISKVSEVTMQQACINGAAGPVYEAANYFKDPGYELSGISVPVHYWWGTKDMSVIIRHAQEIESGVKNSTMYYREGEGHLSLYINCWAEIIYMIGTEN